MTSSIPLSPGPELDRLRSSASGVCVVYADQALPAPTVPSTGRLGVERSGGSWLLHVQRGVHYGGTDQLTADWYRAGTRRFPTFDELIDWLRVRVHSQARDPAHITDLRAVELGEDRGRISAERLASLLTGQVVGQDRQLNELAGAVARHLGKTAPRRPLCALLTGRTGTGKTKTAQTLADALSELTGQAWPLIRLDMSEFSEAHSVARLHGAPPGYIGHGTGEDLAGALARNPRSLVLFDEIEKAHPAVLKALMNLMDVGRLDATRRGTTDASTCLLLFTSNLGSEEITAAVERLRGDAAPLDVDAIARQHLIGSGLRPEVVARFTTILVFATLSSTDTATVAVLSVQRVAADYGVCVDWIEPAYLTDIVARTRGSQGGVRAMEFLVEADLGEGFAQLSPGSRARIRFEATPGTPVVSESRPGSGSAEDEAPAAPTTLRG